MKKYLVCTALLFMTILNSQVPPGYLAPKGLTITQVGLRALDQDNIIGSGYLAADAQGRSYGLSQNGRLYYYDMKTKQSIKLKGHYNSFVSDNLGNVYALSFDVKTGIGLFVFLNGSSNPIEKFKVQLSEHISAEEMGGLDLRNIFIAGEFVYELECSSADQALFLYRTDIKTGDVARAQMNTEEFSMMLAYSYTVFDNLLFILAWTVDADGEYRKDIVALDYEEMTLLSRRPFLREEIGYPDQILVNTKFLAVVDYANILYYDIKKDKMLEAPMSIELGDSAMVDAAITETGIFYYAVENGNEALYFYDFSSKKSQKMFAPAMGGEVLSFTRSICSMGKTVFLTEGNRILKFEDGIYKGDVEIKKVDTPDGDFVFGSAIDCVQDGSFLMAGEGQFGYFLEKGTLKKVNLQEEPEEDFHSSSISSDGKKALMIRQVAYPADIIYKYEPGKKKIEVLFEKPFLNTYHASIVVLSDGRLVLNDNWSIEITDTKGEVLKQSEMIPDDDTTDFIVDMQYYAAKNLIVCLRVNSIVVFDAATLKIKKMVKIKKNYNFHDFTVLENGDIYIIDESDYCVLVKGFFEGL